jgi:hypothetical protein
MLREWHSFSCRDVPLGSAEAGTHEEQCGAFERCVSSISMNLPAVFSISILQLVSGCPELAKVVENGCVFSRYHANEFRNCVQ